MKKLAIGAALAATAAIVLGASVYLTADSRPDQTSAMTASQADLLALARFHDYQHGVTAIDAVIPISGQDFRLDGRVDWRARVGYATLTAARQGGGTELLQWTPNGIAARGSWNGPAPAATPPADGWMLRPWQQGADLDTALQLILDLGSDRPENARALEQSGASVLRRDSVSAMPVTVFAGPSAHTHYWLADDGTLRRFEALVDGSTSWTRVDLSSGSAPSIPHIPGMQ